MSKLSQTARHLVIPEDIKSTSWPTVSARANSMGIYFDDWQDGLGRLILSKSSNGIYAAGVGGIQISLPRQVGKTYTIGAMAFAMSTLTENLTILWTAHRNRTAEETFQAMQGMAKLPGVASYVDHIRRANGQQRVVFKNGSRILFGAREAGFGRGFAGVDMLVFDEAQILGEKALDDMVPSTNTSPNPLIIRMGTPPKPSDDSEAFTEFRNKALSGKLQNGIYVEMSADPDASLDDKSQWAKANPSYPHRTPEHAILRMRNQLGEDSFRREGLGIWDENTSKTAFASSQWESTCIGPSSIQPGLKWCLGVKFSLDGSMVAMARAGHGDRRDSESKTHVELVSSRGVRPRSEGTKWIIDYILSNADKFAQIVVDGKSGAGALVDQLRSSGISPRMITTPSTAEVITAHAMFDDAVRSGRLTHLDDPELSAEMSVITRRKIGASGGFGWQTPEGITPSGVEACTLALWSARTTNRRPRSKVWDNSGNKTRGVVIL